MQPPELMHCCLPSIDAHALCAVVSYIGPGAGLSAIGALLALFFAILIAVVGFVWYPIRRLLRLRRDRIAKDEQ